MKNRLQPITYVDRLSDGGLRELAKLLDGPLQDLFGGIHLLSFFHPNDGADGPHRSHGSCLRLGDWNDLRAAIGTRFESKAGLIVNQV
jgi:sucrose phosphorylase